MYLRCVAFLVFTCEYSGELLLDQGRFADAVEKFDRAIEMEKKK
jgi:hypothetical protein